MTRTQKGEGRGALKGSLHINAFLTAQNYSQNRNPVKNQM